MEQQPLQLPQAQQQPPQPPKSFQLPRIHVLYWEGAEREGISKEQQGPATSNRPTPYLCKSCNEVTHLYRNRLDNLHVCIRACSKEGSIFRTEVVDFVCLSPCLAIRYAFPAFPEYLAHLDTEAEKENVALSTPNKVQQSALSFEECGVTTHEFVGSWDLKGWLRSYLIGVRRAADDLGGCAMAVLLDKEGEELFTAECGSTGSVAQPNITDLLLLIRGPAGISPKDQNLIEAEISRTMHTVRVRLPAPGCLENSSVGLADILMAQERGTLLPGLDMIFRWGSDGYRRWRHACQSILQELLFNPVLSEAAALEKLEVVRAALAAQSSTKIDELAGTCLAIPSDTWCNNMTTRRWAEEEDDTPTSAAASTPPRGQGVAFWQPTDTNEEVQPDSRVAPPDVTVAAFPATPSSVEPDMSYTALVGAVPPMPMPVTSPCREAPSLAPVLPAPVLPAPVAAPAADEEWEGSGSGSAASPLCPPSASPAAPPAPQPSSGAEGDDANEARSSAATAADWTGEDAVAVLPAAHLEGDTPCEAPSASRANSSASSSTVWPPTGPGRRAAAKTDKSATGGGNPAVPRQRTRSGAKNGQARSHWDAADDDGGCLALSSLLVGRWRDQGGSTYELTVDNNHTTWSITVATERPYGKRKTTQGLIALRPANGSSGCAQAIWGNGQFELSFPKGRPEKPDAPDVIVWKSRSEMRKSFTWSRGQAVAEDYRSRGSTSRNGHNHSGSQHWHKDLPDSGSGEDEERTADSSRASARTDAYAAKEPSKSIGGSTWRSGRGSQVAASSMQWSTEQPAVPEPAPLEGISVWQEQDKDAAEPLPPQPVLDDDWPDLLGPSTGGKKKKPPRR